MHIVIDLQAAQAENGRRGIGRLAVSLAKAIVERRGGHKVTLALSSAFPDSVQMIRREFRDVLPKECIRVWETLPNLAYRQVKNSARRRSAAMVRECFLGSLRPDVVLVMSLFEGLVDDAIATIGETDTAWSTVVVLYDLIPLIYSDHYLRDPIVNAWYQEQLSCLRKANILLCISDSTRREAVEIGGFDPSKVATIFAGKGEHFRPLDISEEDGATLRRQYGITKPFVMYAGGMDFRKNIEGLIRAFALLPEPQRTRHQLVIVCEVRPDDDARLQRLAAEVGLHPGQLRVTGYVPEDALVKLYNLASLFVFPSLHEGFGLPALEAMACGCPVIGSGTSSLPEVLGRDDVLFDPRDEKSIAAKMEWVLSSEPRRDDLRAHGFKRAAQYSWERSAELAIAEMARCCHERGTTKQPARPFAQKLRLAYVSPLPPAKSGVSDYSASLVPELAKFYDITVVVDQVAVDDEWIKSNCQVLSVDSFLENANQYDRVLYHFGNSEFHQHMFEMLRVRPGIVVLHDFFLSGILCHMEMQGESPDCWSRELYASHGYKALTERVWAVDSADTVWKYPCSLSAIQQSLGVIVHSPYPLKLAAAWYGSDVTDWTVIPHLRRPVKLMPKAAAREQLGIDQNAFLVCSFGLLGPTKLNHEVVRSWTRSALSRDSRCRLIFVGENASGRYGKELVALIQEGGLDAFVKITGWVDDATFAKYLAAADLAVQLRTLSRGETSGAVLHCMNHGLPTIVNANGSMADLDDAAVWKLPNKFADEELAIALETLWRDEAMRSRIGNAARGRIVSDHHPGSCASLYRDSIERLYDPSTGGLRGLIAAVGGFKESDLADDDVEELANAASITFPPRNTPRQLFVDVSELVQRDSRSGIQRVVKNILREWLQDPPKGMRVEPVYATEEGPGYRYARQFALGFLGISKSLLSDEPIEYSAGDIFVGLDLQPHVVPAQSAFYRQLRTHGVTVKFVVYDLLPINLAAAFPAGAEAQHSTWLKTVLLSDGAICISSSVAAELQTWIYANEFQRSEEFTIDSFRLGSDIGDDWLEEGPSEDLRDFKDLIGRLSSRTTFLMVGTIEPRKGHAQVLGAFERLWAGGNDLNLVIVGKQGWMVEEVIESIRANPELGKRLFWLESAGDEQLRALYGRSDCLIAASIGEGFGLPIVEAGKHGVPILARDIPVFREAAGAGATYFTASNSSEMERAVLYWLDQKCQGATPSSVGIQHITWQQSADQLLTALLQCREMMDSKGQSMSASEMAVTE